MQYFYKFILNINDKTAMKLLLIYILLFASTLLLSCDLNDSENDLQVDINKEVEITAENFKFNVDTLAEGLQNPWGMVFLPNDDLLVTERPGTIRVIRNDKLLDEKITGVPEVYAVGQGGLFELKLHPDYENSGWIYITYAAKNGAGGNTAIMRAKLNGFDLIDKEKIFQAGPYINGGRHFGGHMEFDHNGYLYVSTGERGNRPNAQTLSNHSGKILRLKDDGSIPDDNPFINESETKPEIFTYGNRNPQGMTVHPTTGEIWTHEHGPMGGDEINIVQRGVNYGWPEVTYGKNYDGSTITDVTTREDVADPLHYWTPSIAPCGMEFVTSDLFPAWEGNLLVGSLKFRYIARLELDGEKVVKEEKLIEGLGRVRSILQGPDGLIYVSVESPGMVLRLVPKF
jgi:glucose/arabinose dehydrogenase